MPSCIRCTSKTACVCASANCVGAFCQGLSAPTQRVGLGSAGAAAAARPRLSACVCVAPGCAVGLPLRMAEPLMPVWLTSSSGTIPACERGSGAQFVGRRAWPCLLCRLIQSLPGSWHLRGNLHTECCLQASGWWQLGRPRLALATRRVCRPPAAAAAAAPCCLYSRRCFVTRQEGVCWACWRVAVVHGPHPLVAATPCSFLWLNRFHMQPWRHRHDVRVWPEVLVYTHTGAVGVAWCNQAPLFCTEAINGLASHTLRRMCDAAPSSLGRV